MRLPAIISLFFLKLLFWYGLFLALWTAVDGTYAAAFQSVGTRVFRTFFPAWNVVLRAKSNPTSTWDSELVLHNAKTGSTGAQPFGTRYQGFAPTSMLLSFILASPIPWKRRWQAMLWGMILVHLWIAFAVWLMIVKGYSGANTLAMYHFGPFVSASISYVTFLVTESTAPRYLVPIFFWIAVTFRRGDWENIFRTSIRGLPAREHSNRAGRN